MSSSIRSKSDLHDIRNLQLPRVDVSKSDCAGDCATSFGITSRVASITGGQVPIRSSTRCELISVYLLRRLRRCTSKRCHGSTRALSRFMHAIRASSWFSTPGCQRRSLKFLNFHSDNGYKLSSMIRSGVVKHQPTMNWNATDILRPTELGVSLLLYALGLSLALLCFLYLRSLAVWRARSRGLSTPPGPPPLPFFGNALDMPKARQWEGFRDLCTKYGTH